MIEAYLDNNRIAGKTSFEQLFTDYLNEHAHISHFSRSFFVMLFLGFHDMLLINNGISNKYNVDKIFFGSYDKFNMLKAVIFTNENGKKVMKIRNIFFDRMSNSAPRLLSEQEWRHIKREVRNLELKKFVRKKYMDDLQAERIQSHLTFEVYFFDFMTSLNSREDLQATLRSYLQDKKAELSEYTPEAKEYFLQKVKNNPNEITQRSQILVQEIFSRDLSMKKMKLSKQHINVHGPEVLVGGHTNFQDEKLILLSENLEHFAQSPSLLDAFKDIYQVPGVEDQRAKDLISQFKMLYSTQIDTFSTSDMQSESAECGFTLGAFLALKSSKPESTNIKVVQFISDDIKDAISNNNVDLEHEIEDNNAFFLTLEPVEEPNLNKMAEKLPIVVTFFDRWVGSEMLSMLRLDKSLMSKYALITADYCNNEIKLFTKLLPIGNTIIEDIIVESQLDEIEVTDFDGESSLEIYIKRLLNRIQPVTLEQRLVDITYSSRYILGALISSLGRNENIRVYEMRSMKENPGPFETSYMISFQHKDYQQKEIERYVILNFNEHINSGESEPLNVEPIAGFDTLLVHIDQNFKTNEQNPEVGHIKRTVTVHQALMSTFRDSGDFSLNPINHVPLDYLKTSQDDTKLLFHNCLMDAFQKFKHLVEDSKLPKNQNLMRYSSNFRGIVDGLFYSEPSIKNAIALPSPLSTVQYTISCGTEDIIDFRHADTSDSENELLDDDAVEVIHRDAISERLVTVNFKYTTPELYDKAYIFDGMADMIEKTNLGAAENQIANFYFVDDNVESIKSEELVVTKNKFMDLCNGARRRRSLTSCLSRKTDQPKEVKEQIPKEKIEILENLATASNSVMMLLMIRDLLSDVYHGNKLSVVKDASLLAMTAFSPQIANFLAQKGELMIANEAKIAGYASKALGFGVSRAISLYVFYDLIHNTIDYLDNTNNTSAKIGMEIDGAFLAIDAITLGIQGLETAGYVYGMAAIANPIGAIIGASMVIGLNIYQAMEKVSSINKFIHLNGQELIDESLRAFFHIDPAANVQELMSEESTNEYLMEKATEFLTRQNKYDTLITKSGVLHGKTVQLRKNAVVDMYHMRGINVSRASPKPNDRVHIICPLHEEANEIQSPTFWSKVENFFNKIAHSFTLFYHIISHKNLDVIVKDISDERSSQRGYACHNSFGIKLLNNSTENLAAYFNLGDGNDVISGFANKSNFFQLGAGKKFINGSTKSDIFIISRINISGILNGADGIDTVDFSAVDSEETFFLSDESSKINSSKLRNVENVIGRLNTTDILICDCSIKTIRLNGGWKKSPDFVVIPYRNCTYDMTIYLDGYSTLYNEAHYGNFNYVANITTSCKIKLRLNAYNNQSENIHNIIINQPFLSLDNITTIVGLSFVKKIFKFQNLNARLSISIDRNQTDTIELLFNDGCRLSLANNHSTHLTLYSNLSMGEILSIYSNKANVLGIPMIAHSLIDNETSTITGQSNQSSSIIHNSIFHQSRLFIENCGNHLLLINATQSNETFYFPTIYVQLKNCSCSRLTIDFNVLLSQFYGLNTVKYLRLFAERKNDSMLLLTSTQDVKMNNHYIGKINIVDGFKSNCHQNILVRSYGDFLVLDEISNRLYKAKRFNILDYQISKALQDYLQNLLQPKPLIFTSIYKFIALSENNTEWFSEFKINATLGKMEFFRVENRSLFVTNMRTLDEQNLVNLCSIYLENFYKSKKMWTFTFEANFFRMNLLFHVNELKSAASIDELVKSVIHT